MDELHLDDETLSAYLDRVEEVEPSLLDRAPVETHLAACRQCADRLAALDDTRSALVRTPVEPVDARQRRLMIERALDAAPVAGASTAPDTTVRGSLAWWQRPPAFALGVAATLVVALGVVGLVRSTGSDDPGEFATGVADSAAPVGAPVPAEYFAGDLGDLDDPTAIREAVGVFEGASTMDASGTGGRALTGDALSEEAQAQEVEAAEEAEEADDPAPMAPEDPAARSADLEAASRCFQQVAPPDDSSLVLVATGRFQGVPAVVIALRTSDDGRVLAMILARDDCAILSAQSFS